MVESWISQGEGKTLEFKVTLPKGDQLAKTVCAFANRAGGRILIGLGDEGQVVGVADAEVPDFMDRIANTIHDLISPMLIPEISCYAHSGKTILSITVFPGNATPYFLKTKGKAHGIYVRVGATNKQADEELIQSLERNRINLSFDEDIAMEADEETIGRITSLLEPRLRRTIDSDKLINLKLLVRKGEMIYLSNGAQIVLGGLQSCGVDCARFQNDSMVEFIDRKEYRGDIFSLLENVIMFIRSHIHLHGAFVQNSLRRKDELEIPEIVLREAVTNALLHRDYSMFGSMIKVAVFDSRIDIISPGGLTKSLTIQDILGGRSEFRNRVLARTMKSADLVELWGSGIIRIMEACREAGLQHPDLAEEGLFFRMTLHRKRLEDSSVSPSAGRTNKKIPEEPYAAEILQIFSENPRSTIRKLAEMTGLSAATISRRVDLLVSTGYIKRVGTTRTGMWQII